MSILMIFSSAAGMIFITTYAMHLLIVSNTLLCLNFELNMHRTSIINTKTTQREVELYCSNFVATIDLFKHVLNIIGTFTRGKSLLEIWGTTFLPE